MVIKAQLYYQHTGCNEQRQSWEMSLFTTGNDNCVIVAGSQTMAYMFSSVVFGENPRYCYSLGFTVVDVVVQKLTFCNIFVITEYIYLKLRLCVQYPKSNPCYQGRQFNFFQNYAPFSTKAYILYQAPHSRVLALTCIALFLSSRSCSRQEKQLVWCYKSGYGSIKKRRNGLKTN